jgi:hypothetical protein
MEPPVTPVVEQEGPQKGRTFFKKKTDQADTRVKNIVVEDILNAISDYEKDIKAHQEKIQAFQASKIRFFRLFYGWRINFPQWNNIAVR